MTLPSTFTKLRLTLRIFQLINIFLRILLKNTIKTMYSFSIDFQPFGAPQRSRTTAERYHTAVKKQHMLAVR